MVRSLLILCGALQLTKEGFSGIAVFQLSLFAGRALAEKRKTELCINFLADFTADTDFFARRLSLPFATDLEAVGNGFAGVAAADNKD